MLVLARKLGQKIIIADNIEITVIEINGDQVRLGITAPRSISIHRKELLDQIAAENLEAINTVSMEIPADVKLPLSDEIVNDLS